MQASQLSAFDFQTKYGKRALEELISQIRTRRPGDGRTKALYEAVLGEKAAAELLETGDFSHWEEHCAAVEHGLMAVGIDLSPSDDGKDRTPTVKVFLNRLLGMEVGEQERAFSHFSAYLAGVVLSFFPLAAHAAARGAEEVGGGVRRDAVGVRRGALARLASRREGAEVDHVGGGRAPQEALHHL